MSTRFYCPDPPVDGRFRLPVEEACHLVRVCRQQVRDKVELFDGRGFATQAQVVEIGRDRVDLVACGQPINEIATTCPISLAVAAPKGDRFDWLVEKATELGVARLIPLITERSVVDPRGSKLERLRRTIVEASKQSGRNRLMELSEPIIWNTLARSTDAGIRLLADRTGEPPGRWPQLPLGRPILLAVGPEGGFSPAEIELARGLDWCLIRFGPNILRIETAGLAGVAAVLARVEEPDDDGMA